MSRFGPFGKLTVAMNWPGAAVTVPHLTPTLVRDDWTWRRFEDAEVLQEILQRYRAIGRWREGRVVYDLTRQLFPGVIAVTSEALDVARSILDTDARIMARDALHAAVVLTEGLDAICSYDRDFDSLAGIRRMEPGAL